MASWSDAAAELVGLPAGRAVGMPLDDVFRTEDGRDFVGYLDEVTREVQHPAPVLRVQPQGWSDGLRRLRLTFVRATDDRVALVLGERQDDQPRAATRYGLVEEVAHQVREGVVLASPELEEDGPRVLYANEASCSLMGMAGADPRGQPLLSFLDPFEKEGLRQRVREKLRRGDDEVTERVVVRGENGPSRVVEWSIRSVRAAEGRRTHFVSVQREAAGDGARGASFRGADVDPLTGLPDRTRFVARLARSVEWVHRGEHYAFTVLGFELGELEVAERRWGVAVANLIVEALAWRIRRSLRPNDLVARIAHNRLGVLVEHHVEDHDVVDLMGRIRRETAEPYVIGGQRITQPVTAGALPVAPGPSAPTDAEQVMSALEAGLSARAEQPTPFGFRKVRVAGSGADEVSGAMGLEIRRALSRGELRLRYQPIVDLRTGAIQGLEAFVLWAHPSRGMLPARAFLHHAEGTGSMTSIGRWVAAEACRHLQDWRMQRLGEPFPAIHLNLSAAEFWDPDPRRRLLEVMEEWEVFPSDFRLEVNEGTLSRNAAAASVVLETLVDAGFHLWLEGFGGGRLSMRDILWMPFRHYKLDPGLLWEASPSGGRSPSRLLMGLARLAQDLGRTVVAGNVETEEERELLRTDACALAQGGLFSRPVDPEAVPALLERAQVFTPR